MAATGTAGGGRVCPVLSGYDPLDPAELCDPFPSYARARAQAPIFYSEEYGFWSVTRMDDVLEIVRDTERFSNKMALPFPLPPEDMRDRMPIYPHATAIFFMDNPQHHPKRQMVQAPFTPKRLHSMEPMIRERAEQLLRPDDPDRRIEFVREFGTPLSIVVIGDIIGVPEPDFPLLQNAIQGALVLSSGSFEKEQEHELAEGQLRYWEYLCALVEDRRKDPRNDFSSVLSTYVNVDGTTPSTEEIAGHVNTILGAGFETSAQMMSLGVLALLQHRDQWELLKSDRSLLPTAVEECVRFHGVVRRTFRVALTDVEVGGVQIPEGALIAIMIQSSNRDSASYTDADRFDITRKAENLAFGRGMHFCLGAPLAKIEMRIALETLLELAPEMQLIEGQELRHSVHIALDLLEALQLDLGPVPS